MAFTAAELAAFDDNGFVRKSVFPPGHFSALKDEITGFIDRRVRRLASDGKLTCGYEDEPFSRRMGLLMRDCEGIADGFDIDRLRGEAMFELMNDARLVALLAELLGSRITCSPIQHIRVKPPVSLSAGQHAFFNPGWHQDSGVSQPESDANLIVTCWIPIGPATPEMGCLHVIPGRYRHLPHGPSADGTRILPQAMPPADPVAVACEEGDVIFMNQFLPHTSFPNESDSCRWSVDLRYQATGTPSARPWLPHFECAPATNAPTWEAWRHLWQDPQPMPSHLSFHRIDPEALP